MLDPLPLLIAMAVDVAGARRASLATFRFALRRQLQIAQLFRVQCRPGLRIAFAFAQQVPDDHRELAGHRDRGGMLARRACTRWKNARSGPGARAAAHAASTSVPRACPRPCFVIWKAVHPIGRIGEPSEIAAVIVFLPTDDASFMTGAVVSVHGGQTA